MTVLVTVASRHRSTLQIGEFISATLRDAGLLTTFRPPDEVVDVSPYEAVIIGSAVYAGQWLPPAVDLIERYADGLRDRPVWLFSSGPIGDPPSPAGDPAGAAALVDLIAARDHRVLPGHLERARLGIAEKLIVTVVRAPDGDYRDWTATTEWVRGIIDEIVARQDAPEVSGATRRA